MSRVVCWFSCGAASAVATKMAIKQFKDSGKEIVIAYTEVAEEHPDNKRFLKDCEEWFGVPITILKNEKYGGSIYEVFGKVKYLVGPTGAACTRLLKKDVRKQFEFPDDIQVFGFTSEEVERYERFLDTNNVQAIAPLIDNSVSKSDCLSIIRKQGIEIPMMYRLGYKNNNCIGCVKGGSGYWNKIRKDFPDVFNRMAEQEKILGRTICKYKGERIPLTELPPDAGRYDSEPDIGCGVICIMAEDKL